MNPQREELEARISAYLDNELPPEQRQEVEALLARDASARALLADLQVMRSSLRALPRGRASADLMEAIRARVERQALIGPPPAASAAPKSKLPLVARWSAAAAILLMTGVGGYVIWNLNKDEASTVPQQFAALDERAAEAPAPRDKLAVADESVPEPESTVTPPAGEPSEPLSMAAAEARSDEPVSLFGQEPTEPPLSEPAQEDRSTLFFEDQSAIPRDVNGSATTSIRFSSPDSEIDTVETPRPDRVLAGQSIGGTSVDTVEGARIVTLTCATMDQKRELLDELSAGAVVVRPMGEPSSQAVFGAYRYPATQHESDVSTASTEAPAAEPTPTVTLGTAPAERPRDDDRIDREAHESPTDLLVVVANEDALERLFDRLGLADPTANGQELRLARRAAGLRAGRFYARGALPTDYPPRRSPASRGVTTSQPSETPAEELSLQTEEAESAGDLRVRLHIRVQDATPPAPDQDQTATQPAGQSHAATTTAPEVSPIFDPSVLDLSEPRSRMPHPDSQPADH